MIIVAGGGDSLSMSPKEGREVRFGRNRPDVHVCVGHDDIGVSREQGVFTCSGGHWWLRNIGRQAIRVGASRMVHRGDEPVHMPEGHTTVIVSGDGERLHVLEVFVGPEDRSPRPKHSEVTQPARPWPLASNERLAVVATARRHLEGELHPGSLTWTAAAEVLSDKYPDSGWTNRKVEHLFAGVRLRLAAAGTPRLVQAEVDQHGDVLKDNLIRVLIASNSIGVQDLRLIDPDDPEEYPEEYAD